MASTFTTRDRWIGRLTGTTKGLAIGAVSAGAGAALMLIAQRFESGAPTVLMMIPAGVIFVAGVLIDPRVGVLGVFATFPIADREIDTGIALLTIAEVATFVVAALIVLRRIGVGRTPFPWAPALAWSVALLAWCLVSLPGSIDRDLAVKQIAQLAGGVLFALVVVESCKSKRDIRVLMGGLVTAGVLVAVNALIFGGQMESSFGGATVEGRLQGVFDQPNQLGSFCAAVAMISTSLMFGAASRAGRVIAGGATLALLAGLLMSLSRGAWVGTALGLATVMVMLPRARRAVAIAAVPILASAFFFGSFQQEAVQLDVVGDRVRTIGVLSPYDGRDDIWAEAQRQIIERPLTGFGPGSFPTASLRSASEAATVRPFHAHNLLLTWAAETGIPGALLVIGFGVALWRVGRRAARATRTGGDDNDLAIVVGPLAALIAFAGQGIVDYTLRNALIFLVFWAMAGLVLASDRVTQEP